MVIILLINRLALNENDKKTPFLTIYTYYGSVMKVCER